MTNDSTADKDKSAIPQEPVLPHQIDDKVFRVTMQNKPAFLLLLEQFVPTQLSQHIDLDSLELDNTEYVTAQLKKLQSDVVWQGKMRKKSNNILLKSLSFIKISLICKSFCKPTYFTL